jgi:hypothetical protein
MSNFNLVEKIRLTTPVCKFQYPRLAEPETKFNPEGVYKIAGLIDAKDCDEISTALDELLVRHKESLKAQAPTQKFKLVDLPWSFQDIDGAAIFVVKAKMKASGIDRDGRRWTAAPALFDAKGQPVKDREALAKMWSGTVGRISFEAQPFYRAAIGAGITLRLRAVQVISLIEGGGDAKSFGFDDEEIGWSPNAEAAVPFDSTGTGSDDGDF